MKRIKLTKGKYAFVDDADYEFLNQWNWHFKTGYAHRNQYLKGDNIKSRKRISIYMHRLIMNTPIEMFTDHINGNSIDNRRSNLRICTKAENCRNRINITNPSKYNGVFFKKSKFNLKKKWFSSICVNYKNIYLGNFKTKKEAALAHNLAAKKYHGKFASLNKI